MSTGPDSIIVPRHDDVHPSDAHSLPTSSQDSFDKLATETIGEIFRYTHPAVNIPARISQNGVQIDDYNSTPAILSMVCKRWYVITMMTNSLWARISIETRRMNIHDWEQWGFPQLHRCLQRSGACTLSIRIGDCIKDAVISAILDLIMPHSERWGSIAFAFSLGREFFQKFNTLNGRLAVLEHLEIHLSDDRYFPEDEFTCPTFQSAPKLNTLSITPSWGMATLHKIQIPWPQISKLVFSNSEFNVEEDLYTILGWVSGSLTSLTFAEEFETEWPELYPRRIALPKLSRLHFLYNGFFVLDILMCPLLQELEITAAFEDSITKFLDYSSCALSHIKLSDLRSNGDTPTYHTILQHSSLSTLKSISLSDITDPILDLLNFDSRYLLPSLETLHICLRFKMHIGGSQNMLSQLAIIRKVVESRTRTTALNESGSSVDGLHSYEVQSGPRSFLKHCLFDFKLAFDGPDTRYDWNEEPIWALRSFCLSRNILVSLDISCSSTRNLSNRDRGRITTQ